MQQNNEQARLLTPKDLALIERLLHTSEYIYQRFTLNELPLLLSHYPALGLFSGPSLYGFLLSQIVNPPIAWIGGFGVSWTRSESYPSILCTLVDQLIPHLTKQGVRSLYYSGNDTNEDWLRKILLTQGFTPYRRLYAYDKYDFAIPTSGNQDVSLRPVNLAQDQKNDLAALQAIEEACFEPLWRYDATSFIDIAATHPYFVVAELNGEVVGYQFNALENNFGYLVRIAVHPSVNGQSIGARLMAEATHFFRQCRVSRILLNTQEDNFHAHRLYERFGFIRVPQIGFVLQKSL